MKHRVYGRKLGRNTNERQSLWRNLTRSLILSEGIKTTLAKAKSIKSQADKLLVLAKSGTLVSRRRALQLLPDKAAVAKLFADLGPRAAKRGSGFTRIRRVGRRLGDNSLMVQIEFVDKKIAKKKS